MNTQSKKFRDQLLDFLQPKPDWLIEGVRDSNRAVLAVFRPRLTVAQLLTDQSISIEASWRVDGRNVHATASLTPDADGLSFRLEAWPVAMRPLNLLAGDFMSPNFEPESTEISFVDGNKGAAPDVTSSPFPVLAAMERDASGQDTELIGDNDSSIHWEARGHFSFCTGLPQGVDGGFAVIELAWRSLDGSELTTQHALHLHLHQDDGQWKGATHLAPPDHVESIRVRVRPLGPDDLWLLTNPGSGEATVLDSFLATQDYEVVRLAPTANGFRASSEALGSLQSLDGSAPICLQLVPVGTED